MGGCGECVEFGVNTGHCVLPPGGWRGLVHIPAVRSRMPGALEFRLQKHFAYQATYFLVINSIRDKKKIMLKKPKHKTPRGLCVRGGRGRQINGASVPEGGGHQGACTHPSEILSLSPVIPCTPHPRGLQALSVRSPHPGPRPPCSCAPRAGDSGREGVLVVLNPSQPWTEHRAEL